MDDTDNIHRDIHMHLHMDIDMDIDIDDTDNTLAIDSNKSQLLVSSQ